MQAMMKLVDHFSVLDHGKLDCQAGRACEGGQGPDCDRSLSRQEIEGGWNGDAKEIRSLDVGLWRPQGVERCFARCRGGPARRCRRTERRGQDNAVQNHLRRGHTALPVKSPTRDAAYLPSRPTRERAKLGIAHVPEGRQVFGTSMTVMENLEMGAYARRGVRVRWSDLMAGSIMEIFPILAERRRDNSPVLCRAASSRCWRLGAGSPASTRFVDAGRAVDGPRAGGGRHDLRAHRRRSTARTASRSCWSSNASPRRSNWPTTAMCWRPAGSCWTDRIRPCLRMTASGGLISASAKKCSGTFVIYRGTHMTQKIGRRTALGLLGAAAVARPRLAAAADEIPIAMLVPLSGPWARAGHPRNRRAPRWRSTTSTAPAASSRWAVPS